MKTINESISEIPVPTREEYLADIAKSVGYFVEHPYRSVGDSDSAHGVLFGSMEPYGGVAVKPFYHLGAAMHERDMLERVRKTGFDAIEPLDIASAGLYVYLITAYRPDLRHLGQLNWSESVASKRLGSVLTPTINFAGDLAGRLGANGISHGDFQPKNVSMDKEGVAVQIDLENAQVNLKGAMLTRATDNDLVRFGAAVLRKGLLHDRSISYRVGYLGDQLVGPAYDAQDVAGDDNKQRESAIRAKIDKIITLEETRHSKIRRRIRKSA